MPEVPEVAIEVQYLKTKLIGKTITSVKILSGRYTHEKLKGINKLIGPHKIVDIDSKGKMLWFVLKHTGSGEKLYMLNTLGMTGRWGFYKDQSSRIRFRICCDAKNVYNLYYTDQRNFGQLSIFESKDELQTRIDRLAPDLLKGGLTDHDVVNRITSYIKKQHGKKINLVRVLMEDQTAIVSGIGNYLVAEILYDAMLNPHRNLSDLTSAEIKRLAHSMRKIAKQSYYDNQTGYMENYQVFMKAHPVKVDRKIFPNYLPDIKPDTAFEFKVYRLDKDRLGNRVKKDQIIKGRTIHWVPAVQK
jgi:formamidopyrimidine-DNA glycosylase